MSRSDRASTKTKAGLGHKVILNKIKENLS